MNLGCHTVCSKQSIIAAVAIAIRVPTIAIFISTLDTVFIKILLLELSEVKKAETFKLNDAQISSISQEHFSQLRCWNEMVFTHEVNHLD